MSEQQQRRKSESKARRPSFTERIINARRPSSIQRREAVNGITPAYDGIPPTMRRRSFLTCSTRQRAAAAPSRIGPKGKLRLKDNIPCERLVSRLGEAVITVSFSRSGAVMVAGCTNSLASLFSTHTGALLAECRTTTSITAALP